MRKLTELAILQEINLPIMALQSEGYNVFKRLFRYGVDLFLENLYFRKGTTTKFLKFKLLKMKYFISLQSRTP